MRQLPITLIASLFAVSAIAADSTNSVNTAAPTRQPLVFGPGPVINPENSQYIEDKNAAMEKAQQESAPQPANRHRRLHHGLIPPAQKPQQISGTVDERPETEKRTF
ncbi:hypothetical protein [Enterobacter ludwigii]|uniref:hypothetical protein n=1 Tax=Enterobacter ludwigii TaxID=299767 RepID=UPI00307666E1